MVNYKETRPFGGEQEVYEMLGAESKILYLKGSNAERIIMPRDNGHENTLANLT
jgi:hypothetical protein